MRSPPTGFALALLDHIQAGQSLPASHGTIVCTPTAAYAQYKRPAEPVVRLVGSEQSNSSIQIEDYVVLKLYRSLGAGNQTEIDMGRFLTEVARYANTPPLLGSIELRDAGGAVTPLAVVHGFVRNQGDGWSQTLGYLGQFLDACALLPAEEVEARGQQHAVYLDRVRQLAHPHRGAAQGACDGYRQRRVPARACVPGGSRRLARGDEARGQGGVHRAARGARTSGCAVPQPTPTICWRTARRSRAGSRPMCRRASTR